MRALEDPGRSHKAIMASVKSLGIKSTLPPCTSKRGKEYEEGSIVDMASMIGLIDCYFKIREK